MTRDQLKAIFPNASESFIASNADLSMRYRGTPSIMESSPGSGALEQAQTKEHHSTRFLVRVTSFRRRLLDIDNLCEKFHVDCCRYSGVIPGDDPGQTQIEVTQKKVTAKEREFTRIQVYLMT